MLAPLHAVAHAVTSPSPAKRPGYAAFPRSIDNTCKHLLGVDPVPLVLAVLQKILQPHRHAHLLSQDSYTVRRRMEAEADTQQR